MLTYGLLILALTGWALYFWRDACAHEDTRTIRDLNTTVATLRKGLRDPFLAPVYTLHETTPIADEVGLSMLDRSTWGEELNERDETFPDSFGGAS